MDLKNPCPILLNPCAILHVQYFVYLKSIIYQNSIALFWNTICTALLGLRLCCDAAAKRLAICRCYNG
jgi:hypothetical protein